MTCARGNISEALIVFIVDRYLCHNQFSQTRATFRNEASTLFVDSPANENLLSLEGIVDQYIFMKNQNILLNKQNAMLKQEKHNTQMLLQNLQNVLDSFHARSSTSCNTQAIIQNSAVLLPMLNSNSNIPVVSTSTNFPMQNTMSVTPTIMDNINLSSPMIQMFRQKRKDTPTIDGSKVAKKPRGRPRKNHVQGINTLLPSPSNKVDSGSSSVTTQSLVENYAVSGSQTDSISGTLSNSNQCHIPSHISQSNDEISPAAASNGEAIVTCYNVISTNRGMVQTNKVDAHQTITETLDKPLLNEILTSESDKDRDIWANFDFSNIGLDDWSEIDFSNIEGDSSSI
ncbi:uncharacterized protein LOC106774119 [Vigna radiata var. radiata]|uniref:Uncharacterized protein LOC106774119 n=1 Tax=Vigna radiata var. radiata TaxID=3916 RepID=A0A1S3VEB4_VIGRR|nr:uncharacterized protein LOC106774119 [Vigna radiata var. radiata]XP_014516464.1 uncharacterized protein LOC106774119 [Vigna radiata var. radiata]XP_022641690.1 uncharacterized protein LOC106774119 [Vigna radiata var. radiata]